ncbi:hypothetical protein [Actinomadura algeriensis]|uniref:Uncharacterized protein n=1 Tax=Actinomadura algeriensis TaxID=1679523 RepID=A0ABR9K2F3_9ACTN|nr:hypothetical protein [Actinomadura algeriensis]MBE1537039.1 hypothetical protein [Actinomadura algeriensis]
MVSIDPVLIQSSQDLAAQLAALFHRAGLGEQAFAHKARIGVGTVRSMIHDPVSIPQGATLAKFVKACGEDPQPWLDARGRLLNTKRDTRREQRVREDSQREPRAEADNTLLGRVIGELSERDALTLEVRAAPGAAGSLPVYLYRREFDDRLREEVAGAVGGSRLVMVVGDSSTGKTRACWEAIRAELPDWRVWHPVAPQRPTALLRALREGRVAARTVIWLNETQDYLQDAQVGEQVAAELQALLADDARGPVLVLGSMWPDYWKVLARTPEAAAAPHPHRAVRALLDRAP